MAYNKINNKNQDKEIKYLNKDYQTLKDDLINMAKVYFPDHWNDFSEGNPGMMFLEMAAYVGDVLNFYLDTQIQENFPTKAQERKSLFNHAYSMGYTPRTTSAAASQLTLTHLVPSKEDGGVYYPDYDYALNIKAGSTFMSVDGDQTFHTTQDGNFNFSSSMHQVSSSVFTLDNANNPEYYLLTTKVPSLSGTTKTETFTIGEPSKYTTLTLFDSNIIEIQSITDSEDNIWYEVDYLAQDTVFDKVTNNAANDPEFHQYSNETPYLLKLRRVSRRFITRQRPDNKLEIQFGAGISDKHDEEIIPSPDNVGLGVKDSKDKLDLAFDPSNFLQTKTYGQAPSNTTLTVKYLVGGGSQANVGSNTITKTATLLHDFNTGTNLSMRNFCVKSLAVTNKEPAKGGGSGDSLEDIRLNSIASFSTQKRTVTREDYIVRAMALPPQFGSVSKAYIVQDDQISPSSPYGNRIPNPLALDLYVLGYNIENKLTTLNTATKTNLSTYLEQHRMLTDAINIKDAFVINIELQFKITVYKNFSNEETLLECITNLREYFNIRKWQINQPILINEVQNVIGGIRGVQTVEEVLFKNKSGLALGYSKYRYSIEDAERNGVIYPSLDPSIFEIKYPNSDIKGQVTTYSR